MMDFEWHARAACANSWPEVDMVSMGQGHSPIPLILRFCDNCEVVRECAACACAMPDAAQGIWGGVYLPDVRANARQRVVRKQGFATLRAKVGSGA